MKIDFVSIDDHLSLFLMSLGVIYLFSIMIILVDKKHAYL